MSLPPIRYRETPHGLVRRVSRDGSSVVEITWQCRDRRWGELRTPRHEMWIPSPGARCATIAEYLGPAAETVRQSGQWIKIAGDVAKTNRSVERWCREHANTQTQSGAFLVAPKHWAMHSRAELDLPFLPEFDHPDKTIRELAGAEARRRALEFDLRIACDQRDAAIAAATNAGHSRRVLGRLLGLSCTRVQQLLRAPERGSAAQPRAPKRPTGLR